MTDGSAWRDAFDAGYAPQAVAALSRAWNELAALGLGDFGPKCREPDLTEKLCLFLQSTQHDDRLPGLWSYENLQGELVRTGSNVKVAKRKRTDIRYFTEKQDPVLSLIFEFKKLNHLKAQRDKYLGDDGLLRFVTGEYSLKEPVALMVGILTMHADDCVPPLEDFLNSAAGKTALHLASAGGKQAQRPSKLFASATFDTEHKRPADKAAMHGTIAVSHLFLTFPKAPRVAKKGASKKSKRRVKGDGGS